MNIKIRSYQTQDAAKAAEVWNQVVEDGLAFPQEGTLTVETGDQFFKEQTYTGIAVNTENNEIVGLYILHPNNIGRCGHICNASYTVRRDIRGQHIGEKLVLDCLAMAKEKVFRIMQLMRSLLPIPMLSIYMSTSVLQNSVSFRVVSVCRTDIMRILFLITMCCSVL